MWLYGLLLAVLTWAATRVLWRRLRYDLHKIPTPQGLPLLGQTLEMINMIRNKEEESFMRGRWLRELGFPKIMKVTSFGSPILTITDPHCVKSVVLSRSAPFPRSTILEEGLRILLGVRSRVPYLFAEPTVTPYVKAIRKEYASGMQSSSLKKALPSLYKLLNELVVKIEERRTEGPIEFQHLFVQFALDALGIVAFGMTLGGLDGTCSIPETLIEVGHISKEQLTDPITTMFYKLFPRMEGAKKRQRAIDRLTHEYDKITKETLQREAPTDGSRPIWFGLRSLHQSETEEPSMSYESLRAEVAFVILAGSDTTAHQLAWIFSILAEHPRVVGKILEELRERGLYGDGARELAFEDLGELPYLTAVIKEGMRVAYIVTADLPREVPHDTTLMGYRVPKGTLVIVPGTRWITTDEWGDPNVFRPERWLTDEDMSRAYHLGFSYGPRDCAGQKLAMLEMRLVLIELLSRFRFETVIPFDQLMLNGRNGVVIESAKGIPLRVIPRTAS